MYKLTHESQSLEFMTNPQLAIQKQNLNSFARKLRKICCETFQRNTYFI